MKGFVVPTVDCYHNLTKDKMYEILKVEKDIYSDMYYFHFYDDNDKLTILFKEYAENSFEIYWLPMGA